MMIDQIESALGMLRTNLVQRLAHGDWDEGQAEQAARAVRARLRPERDAPGNNLHRGDPRLSGETLRLALRYMNALHYINDNLDSYLQRLRKEPWNR